MAHRHPRTPEDQEDATASPESTRLLVIAFLTAAGLGLLCGVVWIAWHLLGR